VKRAVLLKRASAERRDAIRRSTFVIFSARNECEHESRLLDAIVSRIICRRDASLKARIAARFFPKATRSTHALHHEWSMCAQARIDVQHLDSRFPRTRSFKSRVQIDCRFAAKGIMHARAEQAFEARYRGNS
jgi:hypothetical protein